MRYWYICQGPKLIKYILSWNKKRVSVLCDYRYHYKYSIKVVEKKNVFLCRSWLTKTEIRVMCLISMNDSELNTNWHANTVVIFLRATLQTFFCARIIPYYCVVFTANFVEYYCFKNTPNHDYTSRYPIYYYIEWKKSGKAIVQNISDMCAFMYIEAK